MQRSTLRGSGVSDRPACGLACGPLPPRGVVPPAQTPRQGRLPASLRDGLRPALTRTLVQQTGSAMRKGRGALPHAGRLTSHRPTGDPARRHLLHDPAHRRACTAFRAGPGDRGVAEFRSLFRGRAARRSAGRLLASPARSRFGGRRWVEGGADDASFGFGDRVTVEIARRRPRRLRPEPCVPTGSSTQHPPAAAAV